MQWADTVGISHCFVEIAYDEGMDEFGLICSDYVTAGSYLLRVLERQSFHWTELEDHLS